MEELLQFSRLDKIHRIEIHSGDPKCEFITSIAMWTSQNTIGVETSFNLGRPKVNSEDLGCYVK